MSRPGGVVHKRAFVTLGHKSLHSACSGVGHKGIVQYAPVGGRALPETYGYVRTIGTRVSELSGSAPVPMVSANRTSAAAEWRPTCKVKSC